MSFYIHINKYTDEFLAANGYSRQEILDGVEALAEANGIKGLDDCLTHYSQTVRF